MPLRACLAPGALALLAACGGTADLVPLPTDVGEDRGRPLAEVRGLTCATSAHQAPYQTTCWFELSTDDVEDLTCTLNVTGGIAEPAQLSPCRGGEFQVTVKQVGKTELEVRARREGGSALRSALTLEGLNAAPKIASFAAAKKQGTAPLATALSWEISDANDDGVVCALDVDVDGTIDATIPDCLATTTISQTFQSGLHKVKLIATDARGGEAFAELSVNAVPPVGDVRVVRLEYGQTVLSPTLRLVPGKDALVRAIVLSDTANLATVVKLSRVVGGAAVDTVTMTGPLTAPTVDDASALSRTYTSKLPLSWIEAGLELRVDADPDDALPETDESNNTLTSKAQVGQPNVLNITAVPVVFGGNTANIPDFAPNLTQLFALASVNKKDRAPFTFTGNFNDPYAGWQNLLGDIATLRGSDGSQDYYFGVIETSQGGGIGGLGFLGQPAAVGLPQGYVISHEVGHNLSLPHAPCGPVSGAAGNYPYPGGEIGTYGIDVPSMQLIPKTFKDLMGYCQPTWISDFFYRQSQTFIESQFYVAPVPPQPVILVRGFVTTSGEVTLKPVHRITARPTPNEGDALITLKTARGQIERRVRLNIDAEEGTMHFSALIPDPGELLRVDVAIRGAHVAARALVARGATGEAQVIAQLGKVHLQWDAAKHPSATLAWMKGDERITFALDLRGGDAEVITGPLEAGGAWEVSLSDGLNARTIIQPR